MDLAEDFIEYVVQRVLTNRRAELMSLERDVSKLANVKKPFPRISYSEAIALLQSKGVEIHWGADFGGDEETLISEAFDRPVIIHRYPVENKAFYMKADPDDLRVALCMDVLGPEGYGEIIGGGQREDDLATLQEKIRAHNLPEQAFSWYLDLRRYGSVPHAGFGMGIERMVTWVCGLHHVREAIPFPRMLERVTP
jgi:asparaginyl-tRNA synthetase